MKAKPKLEQSVQEGEIRAALNAHWHASAVGNANAEHDSYDDDAICDYPQSGERILGRSNLQALRSSSTKRSIEAPAWRTQPDYSGPSPNFMILIPDDCIKVIGWKRKGSFLSK